MPLEPELLSPAPVLPLVDALVVLLELPLVVVELALEPLPFEPLALLDAVEPLDPFEPLEPFELEPDAALVLSVFCTTGPHAVSANATNAPNHRFWSDIAHPPKTPAVQRCRR